MSENCGGEAIENKEIAQDVVVNGTLGFLLQGSNIICLSRRRRSSSWCAAEATSN